MSEHALRAYFEHDDGSLPEVVVEFASPAQVRQAVALLYAEGARVMPNAGVWVIASQSSRPSSGLPDVDAMLAGEIEPFQCLWRGIVHGGQALPDLGAFVDPDGLVLDYRMGADWTDARIDAFLALLRALRSMGGSISFPWWGETGQSHFLQALGEA